MVIPMIVSSTKDLGLAVKTVRQAQGLTQTDLAGASGTGVRFIVDLEKGKPTCEIEKAMRVMTMLGIQVQLTSPEIIES
jgi:y4mF family transcriptional regulator